MSGPDFRESYSYRKSFDTASGVNLDFLAIYHLTNPIFLDNAFVSHAAPFIAKSGLNERETDISIWEQHLNSSESDSLSVRESRHTCLKACLDRSEAYYVGVFFNGLEHLWLNLHFATQQEKDEIKDAVSYLLSSTSKEANPRLFRLVYMVFTEFSSAIDHIESEEARAFRVQHWVVTLVYEYLQFAKSKNYLPAEFQLDVLPLQNMIHEIISLVIDFDMVKESHPHRVKDLEYQLRKLAGKVIRHQLGIPKSPPAESHT